MIEAAGLTKRYGTTLAVDRLTFTVRPGRVTGFLGPNGAGKSTTMRMMLGLDAPTSGTVTLDGRAYGSIRRPLHEVGAVLEVRAVHPGRSARNHLLSLAQSNGIPARRVAEVLDLVGLEGVARRRAGKFSLGMSQRLGLAAALLGDPPVLLCDEPVNGLDPEGIHWIRTLLRTLAAEGRTVFVSSHLMSEMALTADHLIVIGQGRLLADASTTDVIAASSHNHVFVRTPDPTTLTAVLRHAGATVTSTDTDGRGGEPGLQVTGLDSGAIGDLAARHGIAVHELAHQDASLEDAYLQLTRDHVDFRTDSRHDSRHDEQTMDPA
ncbi:MAG TPA: ATP-binding cassette domain-containing protein [Pedococcus sp.]|jgi:ABC-2 type transport system ATP-binding protein|nr:ATP-binding cassette domain-containing protein [Pedococcus sp.]